MKIEQYDDVILKDGRRGCVIEVNGDVSFDIDVGESPKDWETLYSVPIEDIIEVIKR